MSQSIPVCTVRGQDGVQGGAGIATAKTQRVAIATDANVVSLETPLADDVVVGALTHSATTVATTLLTIPAGRTWMGSISIACDVAVAAASTQAGHALGQVTTAGVGVTPAAAPYVTCEARVGANAAAGTVGSGASNSVTVPAFIVVAPAENAVTLKLTTTIAGTAGLVAATAAGRLL